jgi:hypothetical protein
MMRWFKSTVLKNGKRMDLLPLKHVNLGIVKKPSVQRLLHIYIKHFGEMFSQSQHQPVGEIWTLQQTKGQTRLFAVAEIQSLFQCEFTFFENLMPYFVLVLRWNLNMGKPKDRTVNGTFASVAPARNSRVAVMPTLLRFPLLAEANRWIRHTYHQPGGRRSIGVSWCSPMAMRRLCKHHQLICL